MNILTKEEKELARVTTIEALVLIRKKEYQKAVQVTTELIDKGYLDYSLYNARGLAYLNSRHAYRASQDFETAIDLWSDMDIFHANLAIAYSDLDRVDDAIKEYKLAVKLGHRNKDTLKEAIMLCERNDRYEDSIYLSNVWEGLIEP
jgi:Flp pilus assembly protein TadD